MILLTARSVAGPISSPFALHSPLTVESIAAVSFYCSLLLRSRPIRAAAEAQVPQWIGLLVVGAALLPLVPALWFPFTHDEYTLVAQAAHAWPQFRADAVLRLFGEGQGDGFFRPIGTLSIWLTYPFAGTSPVLWHLPGYVLHSANTLLLFLLARALYPGRTLLGVAAAALFAIHGTRPEAASWMAARFDVLSAFFLLAGLVALTRGRSVMAVVSASLSMLTKEAAFCFPLVAALLLLSGGASLRRAVRAALPSAIAATLVFAYRWSLFGGIGGYVDVAGQSTLASVRPVAAVKALLVRVWAVLLFPVNWSVEPAMAVAVGLAVGAVALVVLSRVQIPKRAAWALVAGVIGSSIPALPLLLVGADLSNARVLYIPSICFALLIGHAVSAAGRAAIPCAVAALLFEGAALVHNSLIWNDVAEVASGSCRSVVDRATAAGATTVDVGPLPATLNGVKFLGNGLEPCLSLNGLPGTVEIRRNGGGGVLSFRWDPEGRRLVEVAPP